MDINIGASLMAAAPVLAILGGITIGCSTDMKPNTIKRESFLYLGMVVVAIAAISFILAVGMVTA